LSDVVAGAYVALLIDHGVRQTLKRYGARLWVVK
jgi:hypothetical protein